jgi:hypothetical protein
MRPFLSIHLGYQPTTALGERYHVSSQENINELSQLAIALSWGFQRQK